MGMEQAVTFNHGNPPLWPAAQNLLASHKFPIQVRMIDGELAFPDEQPSEDWRELRLGTAEGAMVTVRRESDRVVLMVWGNADARLVLAWNALTWAFAETCNGQIHTPAGSYSVADYRTHTGLPAALGKDARDDK
jgi:hypothetical protein